MLIQKDSKWKMYIDFDEYDDSRDVNIISCVRDVKFICKNHNNQFDQYNVNKVYLIGLELIL